jgi:hypothetical protein
MLSHLLFLGTQKADKKPRVFYPLLIYVAVGDRVIDMRSL